MTLLSFATGWGGEFNGVFVKSRAIKKLELGIGYKTDEDAAKVWDAIARHARDKYRATAYNTNFSESDLNFSIDGTINPALAHLAPIVKPPCGKEVAQDSIAALVQKFDSYVAKAEEWQAEREKMADAQNQLLSDETAASGSEGRGCRQSFFKGSYAELGNDIPESVFREKARPGKKRAQAQTGNGNGARRNKKQRTRSRRQRMADDVANARDDFS